MPPLVGRVGSIAVTSLADLPVALRFDCPVRAMSCRRCSPHPPFARALGATRRPWEGKEWRLKRDRGPVQRVEAEDIGWGQRQVAANKKKNAS